MAAKVISHQDRMATIQETIVPADARSAPAYTHSELIRLNKRMMMRVASVPRALEPDCKAASVPIVPVTTIKVITSKAVTSPVSRAATNPVSKAATSPVSKAATSPVSKAATSPVSRAAISSAVAISSAAATTRDIAHTDTTPNLI